MRRRTFEAGALEMCSGYFSFKRSFEISRGDTSNLISSGGFSTFSTSTTEELRGYLGILKHQLGLTRESLQQIALEAYGCQA